MEKIYLSRRNLLTLLSKLDRKKNGEFSFCTLIKTDTQNIKYPQTINEIVVTAVEDEDYYINRSAGIIHVDDQDNIGKTTF